MSHIANALAKMKGKTIEASSEDSLAAIPDIRPGATTSPFATGHGASVPPFAAKPASEPPVPAKVRPRWLFPTIAGLGVVVVGAGAWFWLAPKPTPPPSPPAPLVKAKAPAPASEPKRVVTPPPSPPFVASVAAPLPAMATATAAPPPLPAIADAPAIAPPGASPALAEKVRTVALGAAMTGSNSRVLISGRLFVPGETVADGLILQEVLPGLLVFRDTNGAIYTRRF